MSLLEFILTLLKTIYLFCFCFFMDGVNTNHPLEVFHFVTRGAVSRSPVI